MHLTSHGDVYKGRLGLEVRYPAERVQVISVKSYGPLLGRVMALFGKAVKLDVINNDGVKNSFYINKRSLSLRLIYCISKDLISQEIKNIPLKLRDQVFNIFDKTLLSYCSLSKGEHSKHKQNGRDYSPNFMEGHYADFENLINSYLKKPIKDDKVKKNALEIDDAFCTDMLNMINHLKENSSLSFEVFSDKEKTQLSETYFFSYNNYNHLLTLSCHSKILNDITTTPNVYQVPTSDPRVNTYYVRKIVCTISLGDEISLQDSFKTLTSEHIIILKKISNNFKDSQAI